jgi:phage replication-related protein YjqB (UPF0714/DUF867 family)
MTWQTAFSCNPARRHWRRGTLYDLLLCSLAEPRNYQEVLDRGDVPGRDLRIAFGDGGIERCLLVAPHGGGIEPGTSELLRVIADLGTWAWYEFARFLRKGNQEALHIASTLFDEPSLLALLPRTNFVVTLHGANGTTDPVACVGGRWDAGRAAITAMINAATATYGIHAMEAPADLRGIEPTNLTNRGKLGHGIQLEFSRGARSLLFPPDCNREARGRPSPRLSALAGAIHTGLQRLIPE